MQTGNIKKPTATVKPTLSFWQIWNMSFGFLGIQYGFGLQQANMSPIFRYLQADEANIPILWLAGPITGLIVQPIIGSISDRTWSKRWGRRKPFFLIGALVTSLALFLMPNSSALWMAASLMWILDTGLNITQEPFRAFIGDKLNDQQRDLGFAVQSFFVGFGQTMANLMPTIFRLLGLTTTAVVAAGVIPNSIKYPFYIGGLAVLLAVLWTIYTTDEYPPEDLEEFKRVKTESRGIGGAFAEIFQAIKEMPSTMKQLWWVKFFTWFALPLMWQYLTLAVARHAFNAPTPESPGFQEGTEWGNICFAMFNVGCFTISFFLPAIANRIGRRATHAVFLTIGGLGFLSMLLSNDKYAFFIGMTMVGLAWGSILSMPYVLLSSSVPAERMGVYMGIFNGFIVVPQIVNNLTVQLFYPTLLKNDPRNALALAGVCLLLAAGACFLVKETKQSEEAAFPIEPGGN
ncbi:MFS transporter [Spirosoma horti]